MSKPYTSSTIIYHTQAATYVRAAGFHIPEATAGSSFENGKHMLKTGTEDFTTRETLQEFGPIKSRTFDALGGALTGEQFRIAINTRAGGSIERIYLTESGAIADLNVLVTSYGNGRGMNSGIFFEHVDRIFKVVSISRASPARLVLAQSHGIETNKYCPISIRGAGAATPLVSGVYYAKGINATTIDLYSDWGTPTAFSTAVGSGTYQVGDQGMEVGILLLNNPTEAGGYYSTGFDAGVIANDPPEHASHTSAMVSATYTPLVTDNSGNVTSAKLEMVYIPAEWDPDGTMNTDNGTYGSTYSKRAFDHGGSTYGPVFWTGMVIKKTVTFNPVVTGIATYGFPGAMKTEIEITFLKPLENFASVTGAVSWAGTTLAGIELPNTHFCSFIDDERCFQNRFMWRGASNTTVNLTARNFKGVGDSSLGTWDEADYTIFINSENGGVAKVGGVNAGNPTPTEIAAVVGDVSTGGVFAVVFERTLAGEDYAFATVLNHSTVNAYGRHHLMSYQTSLYDGTSGVNGYMVDQIGVYGDFRDYTGTVNGTIARAPELSTIPAGYVMRNWSYSFFGATAAELTTDFGGVQNSANVTFGKLTIALFGYPDPVLPNVLYPVFGTTI